MGAKSSKTKKVQQRKAKSKKITQFDGATSTTSTQIQTQTEKSVFTRSQSLKITNSTQNAENFVKPPFNPSPMRKTSVPLPSVSNLRKPISARGPLFNQSQSAAGNKSHVVETVKKSDKRHDLTCVVPTYHTFGKVRGKTLILNNINFLNDQLGTLTRQGADRDQVMLMELFKELGLNPIAKQDKTAKQMIKAMTSFAGGLKDVDICCVIIMSHGVGDIDKVTEIVGADKELLTITEILQIFSANNCPAMKGRPKIFIFQCCRGNFVPRDQHDALPFQEPFEDMLLAFATSPGFVAYRNPESGSYYIQALCEVFKEYAQDLDVADMLVKVQATLEVIANRKQFCSSENYSFKKCYLHPV